MKTQLAERFFEDGYYLSRAFYDYESEIKPIQSAIRDIIALVAAKYEIDAPASTPEEAMTRGYSAIIGADRKFGGEIYDAVKQIPEFMQLVVAPKNIELFKDFVRTQSPVLLLAVMASELTIPEKKNFVLPGIRSFQLN